ncbi:MAG: glycoside hydrolase family 5 protein [Fibrobacteraceae bacterium]|nr:glycoside hydrolase family 5 protein [Fibrobacteraceae bacterium]
MKQIFLGLAILSSIAFAADLPTATSIYNEMGMGYNIGNTMEVPSDPTAWGNSFPTQQLIDGVSAAGFSTVRIPCAWYTHSNTSTNTINSSWLDSVQTVVDYCIKDSLFVVLNSHWDKGWLEENVLISADTAGIRKRQAAFWQQIATRFKDYDRHLLFASANEPAVQDAYGTAFGSDRMAVLARYHQAFIDAVRATGGNNATRTLVVQGPHADIELTNSVMTLPKDNVSSRLMMEVHFYPYQWALMENDESWGYAYYYWGAYLHPTDNTHNVGWNLYSNSYTHFCDSVYVDSMFTLMQKKYVNQGIPVILGEFGAIKRLSTLSGDNLQRHLNSRAAYYGYVAKSAKAHGLVPIAWDTGHEGDKNMTIIRRQTTDPSLVGTVLDTDVLAAMKAVYGGKTTVIQNISSKAATGLRLSIANGLVQASFESALTTHTTVVLMNSLGQILAQKAFIGTKGTNSISFGTSYRGIVFVQVLQNSFKTSAKITLK